MWGRGIVYLLMTLLQKREVQQYITDVKISFHTVKRWMNPQNAPPSHPSRPSEHCDCWCLRYPQCNLATEWHRWRQFSKLHAASSGATTGFYATLLYAVVLPKSPKYTLVCKNWWGYPLKLYSFINGFLISPYMLKKTNHQRHQTVSFCCRTAVILHPTSLMPDLTNKPWEDGGWGGKSAETLSSLVHHQHSTFR